MVVHALSSRLWIAAWTIDDLLLACEQLEEVTVPPVDSSTLALDAIVVAALVPSLGDEVEGAHDVTHLEPGQLHGSVAALRLHRRVVHQVVWPLGAALVANSLMEPAGLAALHDGGDVVVDAGPVHRLASLLEGLLTSRVSSVEFLQNFPPE